MIKKHLKIPSELLSFLRTLHPDVKRKIKAGLREIAVNSTSGKILKDELEGLRSYRLGKYRIIYREVFSFLEIIAIGEREIIYEDTVKRLLKR
ncbi:MAG: type II toxin-antitoxin system RelE/ParE family toxin [Nitrospirae bacterium]|nr:type II toxin-antitoxin system RelE/ParE family toxin [Nitrospirota bacterium]